MDLATGHVVGVEALVRWNHPDWGLVPTQDLIDAIESSQIMHMLTDHIVREVTAQLAVWNRRGIVTRASVNVSVNDLRRDDLLEVIVAALAASDVGPEQLALEITEGAVAKDVPKLSRAARAIAATGVTLSLDDFGTGYASVQQLRKLPLSEVKIDRTYVADVTTGPAGRAIINSVHQIGRALGLVVVAEGVENQPTVDALAGLPGIIGQGWHLGMPMPAAELQKWWQERGERST